MMQVLKDAGYKIQDAGCRIKRLRNAELKPEALSPWPRPDFDRVSVITYASEISYGHGDILEA